MQVVCPVCNQKGTLSVKKDAYLYVVHRVKKGEEWATVWHYAGLLDKSVPNKLPNNGVNFYKGEGGRDIRSGSPAERRSSSLV